MRELAEDLAGIAAPDHPVTIVYACGSGGTGAGLVLGAKLFGLARRAASGSPASTSATTARTSSMRSAGSAPTSRSAGSSPRTSRPRHRHRRRPRRPRLREEPARGARDDPRRLPQRRHRARPGLHGQGVPRHASPSCAAIRRGSASAVAFLHTGGMFGLFGMPDTLVMAGRTAVSECRIRARICHSTAFSHS